MKNLLFLAAIALMMTGCFAPINSVYDSAALLEKGEMQVKGNYSQYNEFLGDSIGVRLNKNIGGSIAYGISKNINAGLRYERIMNADQGYVAETDLGTKNFDFFEARGKVNLARDILALEAVAAVYFEKKEISAYSLEGRFYSTYRFNKNIEVTAIEKLNIIVSPNLFQGIISGIIVGAGFSTDLDKWAIRPEIGYDGYLNVGVRVNYNFQLRKK